MVAADIVPNKDVRALRARLNLPQAQIVADGESLPFPAATFDLVLCLETIEHVPRQSVLAREIVRVLRVGGACMITTPPKRRYWLRRDPHYGIPGLLLFSDAWQRRIGTWVLGRRRSYDVTRIFSHTSEIGALFPSTSMEVLWNHQFTLATPFERIRYKARHHYWDRIILTKTG